MSRKNNPNGIITKLRQYHFLNRNNIAHSYSKADSFIKSKPLTTFLITLGFLLLTIILGSTIFRTKTQEQAVRTQPKSVTVYRLGQSPRITVQGQVQKSGVVTLVAQTPGIVNRINLHEGDTAYKGTLLVNLASNYQGGNAFSLQRQLASLQYKNTKETFDTQQSIIQRQKDLANEQNENAERLREITRLSINETRDLINLNNDLLNPLKTTLDQLRNNNGNPQEIASLQQAVAPLQAGVNQLQASLRASELQVDTSGPAVEIQNIGKDIALKQLELQEKALKLGLESAGIQLKLAKVQESSMYPSAPFTGTIQKVHVKIGDSVNPGTPLVTIAGNNGSVVVEARVQKDMANKISRVDQAIIDINGRKISMTPSFVSTEATNGQLYSVLFTIDAANQSLFTDKSFISVSIPIGSPSSSNTIPFIPVDSVFQTQNEAFVYVARGGKAVSKKVKLGTVTGSYVTIESGLAPTDQVILTRTVVDGDNIRVGN